VEEVEEAQQVEQEKCKNKVAKLSAFESAS
jgi:hypothetical protein